MLLTKLIGGLLMPVPIILGLLGLGVVFLLVRYRRLGGLMLVAGLVPKRGRIYFSYTGR